MVVFFPKFFYLCRVKVPLPVYILGPNAPHELICYPDLVRFPGADFLRLFPVQVGCELAENVIYLGKQGSFTTREGLKIAYLSGLQSNDLGNAGDCNYSPANLQALEANLGWGDPR